MLIMTKKFDMCLLQITQQECMAIATQCASLPGSVLGEHATPVHLCGVKYMVLRADDNVFYIRQVRSINIPKQRHCHACRTRPVIRAPA